MAYDAYGRPRDSAEPGYLENKDPVPDYTSNYSSEPRDNNRSPHRHDSATMRYRASPSKTDRMTTSPRLAEPISHDGVSPELVAAITEKVKKELFEHLKQTGSIDEQAKSQPMQRESSTKSSSTSSPPPTGRYTPPSPTQSTRPVHPPPPMEYTKSSPQSPSEKPSGVRFSDREPRTRPAPGRTYSTTELSTIDQKWGRLFDSDGSPTQRLGEFLRGLANHIIEDFHPKKSIVVTPVKMAAYYTTYNIEKDPHPLHSIFRAQSNEQISLLYQDLGCQYFLVQDDPRKEPVVPALTPLGFAHWMTINILAYPEEESKRLEKVVLALPIDADGPMVDGKPERLPKQISRHLLPDRADKEFRKVLDDAIADFLEDLGRTNRRKSSITSPPLSRHSSTSQSRPRTVPVEIHQAKTSPKSSNCQPFERERKPYGGAPSDSSTEETIKIERDRQPYTAQPGNGKVYGDMSNLNAPSTSSQGRETSSSRTREQPEIREREPRHHRTQSTTSSSYVPPPRAGGSKRRTSSPPMKSFSHSTPADIENSKYGPPPSSSSSSFTSQGPPQTQSTFSPGSYVPGSSTYIPPPPPMDIRGSNASSNSHRLSRDERQYNRRPEDLTGEFNSPRDAERWDRYQEAAATGRDSDYSTRTSVSSGVDPLENAAARGAPSEEWYRDSRDNNNRGTGYYGTRGGY